ncbi:acyltransferase family protein [Peribacillus sp. SCS-155]|uniref:acyltransferase family protein n=1 Tax=Peribacillus sedimenti TaxID=3115297 RepID=UPI0039066102
MRKKLILIQLSRALVPVLVMLFHVAENVKGYWDYNLLGLTYLPISGGVNYFFALSGFMLYYIYQNKFHRSYELKDFLLNRFIRVYPLYWVLTLIAIPVLFLFPYLGVGNKLTDDIIMHSLLLLPDPSGVEPVLDVAWSLVHTVYFYIIFSLLFLSKVISRLGITIWTLVSIAFVSGYVWSEHYIVFFLFNQYNLIFLAGILCAYIVTKYQFNIKLSVLIAVIGFLGFPLTWLNYIYKVISINFDISTGLSSVLIIFGLASIDRQADIQIPKLLNYLGNASFAIYLAHNLILNTLSEVFSRLDLYELLGGGVGTSLLLLLLITFFGCLVHSFIEKPLIKMFKNRLFKRSADEKPPRVNPASNISISR